MKRKEQELNFLVLRYLEDKTPQHLFDQLKSELTHDLPVTSTLNNRVQDYEMLRKIYHNISNRHLPELFHDNDKMLYAEQEVVLTVQQQFLQALKQRRIQSTRHDDEIFPIEYEYYELINIFGHINSISHHLYDPQHHWIITASTDKLIKIWDLVDGKLIASLRGHSKSVRDIDISFDGKYLLSCGDDGLAILWDLQQFKIKSVKQFPKKKLSCVKFAPSTYSLVIIERDGKINFCYGGFERQFPVDCVLGPGKKNIDFGCFNETGTLFVSVCADLIIWDVIGATLQRRKILHESKDPITFLHKIPHDDMFICGNSHKIIISTFTDEPTIIYLKQQSTIGNYKLLEHTPQSPKEKIKVACLSVDKMKFIVGFSGGVVRVYSISNPNSISLLAESVNVHTNDILSIDVHPIRPDLAVTAGSDGQTIIWRIDTLTPLLYFTRDDYSDKNLRSLLLLEVEFSPDGDYLSVSDDFGSFSLFGIGSESKNSFQWTPSQQFYSTDYKKLIYDANGYCIDEEFHVPPHEVDHGPLCDFYTNPYISPAQYHRMNNNGLLQCVENRYTPETYAYRTIPMEPAPVIIEVNDQEQPMVEDNPEDNDEVVYINDDENQPTRPITHLTRNAAIRLGVTPVIEEQVEMGQRQIINDISSSELSDSSTLHSSEYDDSDLESEERRSNEINNNSEENAQPMDIDESDGNNHRSLLQRAQNEVEDSYQELLKEVSTAFPHWIHRVYSEYNMTCHKKRKTYFPNIGDVVYYLPRFHEEYLKEHPKNITGNDNTLYVESNELIEGQIIGLRLHYDHRSNEMYTSIDIKLTRSGNVMNNVVFTQTKIEFVFLAEAFQYAIAYINRERRLHYNGGSYRLNNTSFEPLQYNGISLLSSNGNVNVSIYEIETDYIYHRDHESFSDEVHNHLLNKIQEVINNPIYDIFVVPVDVRMYPNYLPVCPFPIDLTTILIRLRNDEYYHKYPHVEFEIFKIIRNAVTFNDPFSQIGQTAIKLANEFVDIFTECRNYVSFDYFIDLNEQITSFQQPRVLPQTTRSRSRRQTRSKMEIETTSLIDNNESKSLTDEDQSSSSTKKKSVKQFPKRKTRSSTKVFVQINNNSVDSDESSSLVSSEESNDAQLESKNQNSGSESNEVYNPEVQSDDDDDEEETVITLPTHRFRRNTRRKTIREQINEVSIDEDEDEDDDELQQEYVPGLEKPISNQQQKKKLYSLRNRTSDETPVIPNRYKRKTRSSFPADEPPAQRRKD